MLYIVVCSNLLDKAATYWHHQHLSLLLLILENLFSFLRMNFMVSFIYVCHILPPTFILSKYRLMESNEKPSCEGDMYEVI